MKMLPLCLCLFMGCAGTTPQDVLEEFARGIASANALYHAQCDGREDEPRCVVAREHYNNIVGWLETQNEKLPK